MRGTYVNRSNKKKPATQQPPTRVQTRLEIINIAIIQVQRTGLISVVLFAPQRSSFSECTTAHRIRINKRMTKEINYRCVCGPHYGNYGENKEKPSVLVLPKPDRLPRTCTERNYWTLLLWRMPSRNDRKKGSRHCFYETAYHQKDGNQSLAFSQTQPDKSATAPRPVRTLAFSNQPPNKN